MNRNDQYLSYAADCHLMACMTRDEHERRIARYKVALDSADARDRRRSTIEIEWNGEMIGDLRRQSRDA